MVPLEQNLAQPCVVLLTRRAGSLDSARAVLERAGMTVRASAHPYQAAVEVLAGCVSVLVIDLAGWRPMLEDLLALARRLAVPALGVGQVPAGLTAAGSLTTTTPDALAEAVLAIVQAEQAPLPPEPATGPAQAPAPLPPTGPTCTAQPPEQPDRPAESPETLRRAYSTALLSADELAALLDPRP